MSLTTAIPIVMLGLNDPVGNGLIKSLAHPGGNVTGNTNASPDLAGKALGLLKELVPAMRRVAVLVSPADQSAMLIVAQLRTAAQALNIEPVFFDFVDALDFNTQLERLTTADVQAFYIANAQYFNDKDDALFQFEIRTKIPKMSNGPNAVPFTGVIAYGSNRRATDRQTGYYVDQILRGVKPADLPVQQPSVYDLAINTATARAIGLTIPFSALAQATIIVDEDYGTAR